MGSDQAAQNFIQLGHETFQAGDGPVSWALAPRLGCLHRKKTSPYPQPEPFVFQLLLLPLALLLCTATKTLAVSPPFLLSVPGVLLGASIAIPFPT